METEKPEECECCQFKTEALKEYRGMGVGGSDPREASWCCDLCASTMASTMMGYPSQFTFGERYNAQAICYVGNTILAAIKELKNAT